MYLLFFLFSAEVREPSSSWQTLAVLRKFSMVSRLVAMRRGHSALTGKKPPISIWSPLPSPSASQEGARPSLIWKRSRALLHRKPLLGHAPRWSLAELPGALSSDGLRATLRARNPPRRTKL